MNPQDHAVGDAAVAVSTGDTAINTDLNTDVSTDVSTDSVQLPNIVLPEVESTEHAAAAEIPSEISSEIYAEILPKTPSLNVSAENVGTESLGAETSALVQAEGSEPVGEVVSEGEKEEVDVKALDVVKEGTPEAVPEVVKENVAEEMNVGANVGARDGKKVWSREYVSAKIEKLKAAREARVREIAEDIQKNGAVTLKEVRTRYHVTRQTAYAYMRELVKKGLAVRKKVISFVRPDKK